MNLNTLLRHIKAALRHPLAYAAAMIGWRGETDFERWKNPDSLSPSWDARTILIAQMVPDGSSVIEFGAARLTLRRHLGPNCTYQPVDLVSRTPEMLAFDLNEGLPELPGKYNFAVFSGVLEYVHDLDALFSWLKRYVTDVIFSYALTDQLSDPVTRKRNGWVNNLSAKDVHAFARKHGLQINSEHHWEQQTIYNCRFSD